MLAAIARIAAIHRPTMSDSLSSAMIQCNPVPEFKSEVKETLLFRGGLTSLLFSGERAMRNRNSKVTIVAFRKWRSEESGTIALFPAILADLKGNCLSYEHAGQHGAADYQGAIARSPPPKAMSIGSWRGNSDSLDTDSESFVEHCGRIATRECGSCVVCSR